MAFWKNDRVTPEQFILGGFLILILTGTLLLMLPIATKDGQGASFLDALFTSTSATCVTGLVVQNTGTYFSLFGQIVILSMIQIGGMGVVTLVVAIAIGSRRQIKLKQRWIMQESISAPQMGGIVRITGFIVKGSLLIETIGAVMMSFTYVPQLGPWKGLWTAVFHSVSAFCNAGFDITGTYSETGSLTAYVSNLNVNFVIMALIVIGGIGFMTWDDISQHRWDFKAYRLQSKLILITTALLIVIPALFFFFYEFALPQWGWMDLNTRVLASFFASVTPRTAGFNTIDLAKLSQPAVLITIALMLIGGSPGSTAGGFKTTTLAVFVLSLKATFHHRDNIQALDREIPVDVLRKAVQIFALYLILFLAAGLAIACIDGVPLWSSLFEAASAIGTVGLTLGITSEISAVSRIILILLMYFGRVGVMTLIYAVPRRQGVELSHYPSERVTVG